MDRPALVPHARRVRGAAEDGGRDETGERGTERREREDAGGAHGPDRDEDGVAQLGGPRRQAERTPRLERGESGGDDERRRPHATGGRDAPDRDQDEVADEVDAERDRRV